MKKIILAINDKKTIKKLKEKYKLQEIIIVQYREAIIEILEENINIEKIVIEENIPGIISIEKLIKTIKSKNKKININIILEKEDFNKKDKLKNLEIKGIYIKNKLRINKKKKQEKDKIDKNKIYNKKIKINKILKNKFKYNKNKKEKEKTENKINKIKNKNNNKLNKKIIFIYGDKKTGKTTIINLFFIYLLKINKKILLINLNKKIENNYLKIFNKYLRKNKIKNTKEKESKKQLYNYMIKINFNLTFLPITNQYINYNEVKKFLFENSKKYDYILVDSGNNCNYKIKQIIMKFSNIKINVIENKRLGIEELERNTLNGTEGNYKKPNCLHIIYNKYYFNSVSQLILKNLFKNTFKIHTIFYRKKLKNLTKQIQKNKNSKLNKNTERKIKKY